MIIKHNDSQYDPTSTIYLSAEERCAVLCVENNYGARLLCDNGRLVVSFVAGGLFQRRGIYLYHMLGTCTYYPMPGLRMEFIRELAKYYPEAATYILFNCDEFFSGSNGC